MWADEARLPGGARLATDAAVAALRQSALVEYPRECIGLIDRSGGYVALRNVAPDPERFAMADRHVIADYMARDELRALCHSHPGGPDCPSEEDMRAQLEMEVPFVIVSTNGQATTRPFAWGDQLLDDGPAIGRQFRHGVDDCYACGRLWFKRERGIILPDYPRSWEWWLEGRAGEKDLYRRYFREAGFYEIDRSEVRHGDVWLAAVRADVPNHAGIYLDGGLALHHPSSGLPHDPGRLSKRESIARWGPWTTHWLRRD
ncbi:MAG: Mov34/MPN/PAD-1 family protein [Allosphingosinicella sp.]